MSEVPLVVLGSGGFLLAKFPSKASTAVAEAIGINKSLAALHDVMMSLSAKATSQPSIPNLNPQTLNLQP